MSHSNWKGGQLTYAHQKDSPTTPSCNSSIRWLLTSPFIQRKLFCTMSTTDIPCPVHSLCCSCFFNDTVYMNEKKNSARITSTHLQRLSSSSVVAPADTLHKDSAGALPFALPFLFSQNEHCPGKWKTHFFYATWSRFSCKNKAEERNARLT